jgi:hypothetical protein
MLTRRRWGLPPTARRRGRRLVAAVVVAGVASAVGASGALATTTVALWRMDERSGTSMLDSARGHTGTLHGGIKLFQPGWHGLSAS